MKKLSLAAVLYLSTAAVAFADSNSLIITQTSVGGGAPSLNFTQSSSGALASVIQNGNNALTGVQTGAGGTTLNVDQENPTNGAVNTINYTGRGNSNVTIDQRAANGIFTASGSAGNTANIDIADNTLGGSGKVNSLALDQVGFNNTATVYDTFAGAAGVGYDALQIGQYSDSAAAGNKIQVTSAGRDNLYALQQGGNIANISILGGGQNTTLTQTNTADNATSANTANLTISGAGLNFTQTGTLNNLTANLNGTITNFGLQGFQSGTNNKGTVTQTHAEIDLATNINVLDQTGTNNTATATQTNTVNSHFTIAQNGTGDMATVAQTGTNNVASLTQQGNINTASLTQSGTGATAIIAQH